MNRTFASIVAATLMVPGLAGAAELGAPNAGAPNVVFESWDANNRILTLRSGLIEPYSLFGCKLPASINIPATISKGRSVYVIYDGPGLGVAGGPANNNNNSWGVANTASGDAAASPQSRIYAPNTTAVPTPGTVVIRLNGRVQTDIAASWSSADKAGIAKVNPINFAGYMRLYPGVDAMAANGLRYGAGTEIRQNFNNAGANPTPSTSGSTNSSTQTLFVRRAFTYLAHDSVGIVRVGLGDGVQGLFDPGIFTSQGWDAGIGQFNGGSAQVLMPAGPAGVPFVWLSQVGAEYDTNKIVYLSPQFFGFDFGAEFAPYPGNGYMISSNAGCTAASATCINVTSGGDLQRWTNKWVFGARYQQVFSGVDFKAYADYTTAGKQGGAPGVLGGSAAGLTAASSAIRYDNLGFVNTGVAVSAMGFTVAADYIGGAVNGQLGMRPTGGKSMNAVVAGVIYANGPLTLGAEYGVIDHQGAAQLVGRSQRHEWEVAFGGNYALAPGLNLVGEYIYQQRHQGGVNMNTGAVNVPTADSRGQTILFSTVVTW